MGDEPPPGVCPCGNPVPPRKPLQIDWCDDCLAQFEQERDDLARALGDSFDGEAFERSFVADKMAEYRERVSRGTA